MHYKEQEYVNINEVKLTVMARSLVSGEETTREMTIADLQAEAAKCGLHSTHGRPIKWARSILLQLLNTWNGIQSDYKYWSKDLIDPVVVEVEALQEGSEKESSEAN